MYQAAPAAGAKLINPLPEVAGVCWVDAQRASSIELGTDLGFLVGIRLVFLGFYQTDTKEKLGRYILV